ncbi:MAG TPA: ATP-binding protein [Burkholderiales bacterium]|nr:ATP-binding protein [Burkholderiales bacterium]
MHARESRKNSGVLFLVCGKIASGKSTMAESLAAGRNAVLFSEDDWLSHLYPGEIKSIEDYVRCTARLRNALTGHIRTLLGSGLSVVLDFPANTPNSRNWARDLFEHAGAAHELHFLDVPDEICKARLRERNGEGKHPFAPSEAEYDEFTRYFVPPSDTEGFDIVRHAPSGRVP